MLYPIELRTRGGDGTGFAGPSPSPAAGAGAGRSPRLSAPDMLAQRRWRPTSRFRGPSAACGGAGGRKYDMAYITLRVLHGADRGRVFDRVPTPVTIGREEGNSIQLNDEGFKPASATHPPSASTLLASVICTQLAAALRPISFIQSLRIK